MHCAVRAYLRRKLKLFICMPWGVWGSGGGIVPLIINLCTRWTWVHALANLSLGSEPPIGVEKERWMILETWCSLYILVLPGIKPSRRPQVLYRPVCLYNYSCILIIWRNTKMQLLCVVIHSCLLLTSCWKQFNFIYYSRLGIFAYVKRRNVQSSRRKTSE